MPEAYRIEDEPLPSTLARWAVNPFWPFLAVMFGGVWLSWPLFALNAVAIGSASRRREFSLLSGGFLAVAAGAFAVRELLVSEALSPALAPYALLVLTVVKLLVTYRVHILQARSFELFEYFGGVGRNGMLILLAGFIGRVPVLGLFQEPWLWVLL